MTIEYLAWIGEFYKLESVLEYAKITKLSRVEAAQWSNGLDLSKEFFPAFGSNELDLALISANIPSCLDTISDHILNDLEKEVKITIEQFEMLKKTLFMEYRRPENIIHTRIASFAGAIGPNTRLVGRKLLNNSKSENNIERTVRNLYLKLESPVSSNNSS